MLKILLALQENWGAEAKGAETKSKWEQACDEWVIFELDEQSSDVIM